MYYTAHCPWKACSENKASHKQFFKRFLAAKNQPLRWKTPVAFGRSPIHWGVTVNLQGLQNQILSIGIPREEIDAWLWRALFLDKRNSSLQELMQQILVWLIPSSSKAF